MDYSIQHEDFEGRDLCVRLSGLFGSAKLVENGTEVSGSGRQHSVRGNSGETREIVLESSLIDRLPVVVIDGVSIRLDRALRWYEYLWMGMPLLLVFAGGALGVVMGIAATWTSARIFRSERSIVMRYALTGLVSLATVLVFLGIATGVQLAVDANRDPASKAALAEVASLANQDLPRMVDDVTELVEIEGLEGILSFRYRLVGITSDEIDADEFERRMGQILREGVCGGGDLRTQFLEQGIAVRQVYFTADDQELRSFDFRLEDCN